MRLVLTAIALLLVTPAAMAQVVTGPEKNCADRAGTSAVQSPASDASRDAAAVATGQTPDNSAACPVAPDGQGAPSGASASLAATIAEAERRVANLKFEVGPPPRNLTRGAGSSLRPAS